MWWTPIKGKFKADASVFAAFEQTLRHPGIPGPLVNATPSIWDILSFASSKARLTAMGWNSACHITISVINVIYTGLTMFFWCSLMAVYGSIPPKASCLRKWWAFPPSTFFRVIKNVLIKLFQYDIRQNLPFRCHDSSTRIICGRLQGQDGVCTPTATSRGIARPACNLEPPRKSETVQHRPCLTRSISESIE